MRQISLTNISLRSLLVLSLVVLSVSQIAAASESCPVDLIPLPEGTSAVTGSTSKAPVELEADQIEMVGENSIVLDGKAEIHQGRMALFADHASYDKSNDTLSAQGEVVFFTEQGDRFAADSLTLDVATQIGEVVSTEFLLADPKIIPESKDSAVLQAHGKAESLNLEGEGVFRLSNVRYSTCPQAEDDLFLQASELVIDQEDGSATAENVEINFMGHPVLSLPWISFPIDDQRRSGFLFPGFGYSDASGLILEVPYYWNIAPERDATLVTRYYSMRGLDLDAEFRYLQSTYSGEVNVELLPHDAEYGSSRYLVELDHRQDLGSGFDLTVDLNNVSDSDFFSDLKTGEKVSFLPQSAVITYTTDEWSLSGLFSSFQVVDKTVDESSFPHRRLPQLTFNRSPIKENNKAYYGLSAQATRFDHDTKIAGTRIGLKPEVGWWAERDYGYLNPSLEIQHTQYGLSSNLQPGQLADPSFTVPILTLSGGLYLERDTKLGQVDYHQTLDPSLTYTYIPEVDYSDIPVFDTDRNEGGGWDGYSAANEVTLSLATHLNERASGLERLSGSMTQTLYLDGRENPLSNLGLSGTLNKVTNELSLNGGTEWSWDQGHFVHYSLGAVYEANELSLNGGAKWSREQGRFVQYNLGVVYEPKGSDLSLAKVSYNYNEEEEDPKDQIDTTLNWALSSRSTFSLTSNYSLKESRNITTEAALLYDACCWAVGVTVGREGSFDEKLIDRFMVTLQLKTFGSFSAGGGSSGGEFKFN